MQQQLQLNNDQKIAFEIRMNAELDKMIMSWDNDLKRWYPTALHALTFASAASLNIAPSKFITLFNQETHGLKMQVVMGLVNNCEARTPFEMNVTAKDWAEFLLLNAAIGARWNEMHRPVYKKVYREFEIMASKPRLVIAEA